MVTRNTSRLAFFFIYFCFFVQWYLLSFVFKNLRVLAPKRLFFFPSNYKAYGPLFILSIICAVVSIAITNNWILPEAAKNEKTFIVIFYIFNAISFAVLGITQFFLAIFLMTKSN